MHKFVRNLITQWRKLGLPFEHESIVLAVSGGADSVSLLVGVRDLVKRKKLHQLKIVVAHFNHKLRGTASDADEKLVRPLADDSGFEFVAGSGKIPQKGNLEQNARNARYRFLAETALNSGAKFILTGHTKNDQAETFLMNLIRGSGPDGLGGMAAIREIDSTSVSIARPLLSWATRDDTVNFCDEHSVAYASDAMNDDPAYTRVRIRKTILPMLAELNPKIVDTLARTADLIRAEGGTKPRVKSAASTDRDLNSLSAMDQPGLYAELRMWLRINRGDLRGINLKHIQAVERLIHSRKSGKTVEIPRAGRVTKQGGKLVFSNIKVEK